MSQYCGCDSYFEKIVGLCVGCVDLCRHGSKDCTNLCPCYNLMQEQLRNITELLTHIRELQTENEDLSAWVVVLACSLGVILIACVVVGLYWYYRRRHPELSALNGLQEQDQPKEKARLVVLDGPSPCANGVAANGTAATVESGETTPKTSYMDDGETALMMPDN